MAKKVKTIQENRLRNATEAAIYRDELLKKQNGIDPIGKFNITKPVLDHMHYGEQKCRAVLQNEMNRFEGKVHNAYKRFLEGSKNIDNVLSLPDILRNLADYLENDYSNNKIHHTAAKMDEKKFKALKSDKQCEILEQFDIIPEKNSSKRAKQAYKLILEGKLNMLNID